jgi:uncharacterized membrane protein
MHRFVAFWVNLRSSLWFVPAAIVLAAVVLGLLLSEIGRIFPGLAQAALPPIFGFSAEGSRAMLSSIASSMITVAGVAFSVTIVALSLASTQYSPRVLRHFMRDRGNQYVLGMFVGVFSYCLVVLPHVRGGDEGGYVPALAVAFGVFLALVGVGCLIYFIHHVASAIQASSIVAVIAAETHRSIEQLFPEEIGEEGVAPPEELAGIVWQPVSAPATGMLQLVNEDALLETAVAHDCVVRLEHRIGDFVVRGTTLVSVSCAGEIAQKVHAAILGAHILNRTRTVEQDAAFGLRQIVDIALRALSPSMNDTTTAVLCVNYLADLMHHLAARHPASCFRLHDGRLRVVAPRPGFDEHLGLAFDQILANAQGNVVLLERVLWAIETIESATRTSPRRAALAAFASDVRATIERQLDGKARASLQRRSAELLGRLKSPLG